MQIEAFLVVGKATRDILFCCYNLGKDKTWNDYLERLVSLIPEQKGPFMFMPYDDIAIGTVLKGDLWLWVTARKDSRLMLESAMRKACDQLLKIVAYVCKSPDKMTQGDLIKRDPYIQLQLLIQEEISLTGYLHFIEEERFPLISNSKDFAC